MSYVDYLITTAAQLIMDKLNLIRILFFVTALIWIKYCILLISIGKKVSFHLTQQWIDKIKKLHFIFHLFSLNIIYAHLNLYRVMTIIGTMSCTTKIEQYYILPYMAVTFYNYIMYILIYLNSTMQYNVDKLITK